MKLTSREPTPDMVEAERVKFEAWCAAKDINASYWLGDKRNGYNNGRVSDYWFGWKERAMHDARPKGQSETRGIRRLYEELVFAVGNKHPGETRHQTALRYIQQAEKSDVSSATSAALKGKQ